MKPGRQRFHVVLGPRNPEIHNWHVFDVWCEDNHEAGELAQERFGAASVHWDLIEITRAPRKASHV